MKAKILFLIAFTKQEAYNIFVFGGIHMGLARHEINTQRKMQMIDITKTVEQDITIQEGICVIFSPHATCGIVITSKENILCNDLLYGYAKAFPAQDPYYHSSQDAGAHMKSAALGCSQTLIIHEGKLLLGEDQAIYFTEQDGPNCRSFMVKILEGSL